MFSTSETADVNGQARLKSSCKGKGKWNGMNIAAMVLGFIFCWPVGLFILFWVLNGRDVRDLPGAISDLWSKFSSGRKGSHSGNVVFDDFQQTQVDRINEIKEEIKVRGRRFVDFRTEAQRRADEAEFKKFMSEKPDIDA